MRHLFLLASLALTSASFAQGTQTGNPPIDPAYDRIIGSDEAHRLIVDDMFKFMEAGKYTETTFPKVLTWSNLPRLFYYAKSKKTLVNWSKTMEASSLHDHQFPINPLSSQMQNECSEGMVALWLTEGIRKGRKFASSNPLCLPSHAKGDWIKISEANHDKVLAAYEAWWTQVKSKPMQEGQAADPLKGTGLHWH